MEVGKSIHEVIRRKTARWHVENAKVSNLEFQPVGVYEVRERFIQWTPMTEQTVDEEVFGKMRGSDRSGFATDLSVDELDGES